MIAKKQLVTYSKPSVRSKKIKANFFSSRRYRDGEDLLGGLMGIEVLAQSGPLSCFPKNTNVLMGTSNKTKPIDQIKEGETVASFNVEQQKQSLSKVLKQLVHIDAKVRYIIINKTLKTTEEHLFWVNSSEWKRAGEFKVGDWLLTSEKEKVTISELDSYNTVETVYNLELEGDDHNYFAENILVHNYR
ncbi:MAG: Hint domain-containing protein [Candidatus Roizmanbacteria bacterium]|nr:Hint domain-containing protein [Candidatus Roizmanbacteria bacterium]